MLWNEMNVRKTKAMRILREPPPLQIMTGETQLENVEYFHYLGSRTTNDAKFTREIKYRIFMTKAELSREKTVLNSRLDLYFRKNLSRATF
jgi:hypothetical protein